ncbi:MAG: hypothetical protein ACXVYM_08885, partial [Gaiellaceae bacterium]
MIAAAPDGPDPARVRRRAEPLADPAECGGVVLRERDMRFAVIRQTGPAWDHSRPLREQAQWSDHADFMNGLVEDGFVLIGGPLGDGSSF